MKSRIYRRERGKLFWFATKNYFDFLRALFGWSFVVIVIGAIVIVLSQCGPFISKILTP